MMFVDSDLLHLGGSKSREAGEHAHHAAEHLSRAELLPQMFGDFAAADEFHASVASVQVYHTRLLLQHRGTLGAVGRGAVAAAARFTEMDDDNASSVRAVQCDSAT